MLWLVGQWKRIAPSPYSDPDALFLALRDSHPKESFSRNWTQQLQTEFRERLRLPNRWRFGLSKTKISRAMPANPMMVIFSFGDLSAVGQLTIAVVVLC